MFDPFQLKFLATLMQMTLKCVGLVVGLNVKLNPFKPSGVK